MDKCKRCGKPLDTKRWLCREVPRRKLALGFLCTGYWVEEFKYSVCAQCSRDFEDFMKGKEIAEIQRGCSNCGSLKTEDGFRFCPDCGAKVIHDELHD